MSSAANIKTSIDTAFEKVQKAVKALAALTAQEDIDEAAYQALVDTYDEAVYNYSAALEAKGVSTANLIRVQLAANRARTAADAVFAFHIPPNPDDDTTVDTDTPPSVTPPSDRDSTTSDSADSADTTPSSDNADNTEGMDTAETADSTDGTQPAAPAPAVSADVASNTVGVVAAAVGDNSADTPGDLQAVSDQSVPLADISADDTDNSNEADMSENLVNVSDEGVPLSNTEIEQQNMSWWWLLLVVLLGATGTEMYRRHQKQSREIDNRKR